MITIYFIIGAIAAGFGWILMNDPWDALLYPKHWVIISNLVCATVVLFFWPIFVGMWIGNFVIKKSKK